MTKRKKPSDTVVMITGASSGIGKITAESLAARGYRVYGTSRTPEAQQAAFPVLMMDVTEQITIINAISEILEKEQGIDVLINNAGMGIGGAIEETELTLARKQFDVVFWGGLLVSRHVLPIMREQGRGLIINVSSIAGKLGLPYQGFYSAAKFAVEGLSEALSMEVKPFGIKVVLVEPGDMSTGFTSNREWVMLKDISSPYLEQVKKTREIMDKNEVKGGNPAGVAKKIVCIVRKKHPAFRYVVGKPDEKLAMIMKVLLPFRLFEKILSSFYGVK